MLEATARTFVAAPLLLVASAFLGACESKTLPATIPVTVGGKTFNCKLAITEAAREQGLGGVKELGPDEGMIFAFTDAAPRNFWMRRCVMGLDIAFIDPFGFVTAVHTMPQEDLQREGETDDQYFGRLKRYPSVAPAQYALEVAPGALAPLGVRRGVRVEFDRALLKTHTE
jgi:uncharacterized membrane protein (UPF0127 family)